MPFLRAAVTLLTLFLALPAFALDRPVFAPILTIDGYGAGLDPDLPRRLDGIPMQFRGRGPIWTIYPATAREGLHGSHRSRMIWRLTPVAVEH